MQLKPFLSACLVLAAATSSHAQEVLRGVTFNVDLLNLTTVGTDIEQVQVFTLNQTVDARGTFTQRATTVDYGTTFRRIDMRLGNHQALSLSAGYRRRGWGLTFRRWGTEAEASFEERITSSPERVTSGTMASIQSQTVQGCRMWDNTQPPVANMRDASGFSPVDCYARNALDTSKMDFMVERAWIESPGLQAVFRVGGAPVGGGQPRAGGGEQKYI